MGKSDYLSSTFNDVIFKGRNRAYGTYIIRQTYGRTVSMSAILAISIFSGALVGPVISNIFFEAPVKYEKPVYTFSMPIDIPPPPVIEPKKTDVILAVDEAEQLKTKKSNHSESRN